jgi:hypothetical protein
MLSRRLFVGLVLTLGVSVALYAQAIPPATGDGVTANPGSSAITIGTPILPVALAGGAVVDSAGNLLVFDYTADISIFKSSANTRTHISLVPYGKPLVKSSQEYPLSFSSVAAGSKAVYGVVTADTVLDSVTKSHAGLVALTTSDGQLPVALQPFPIDSVGELKVVPGTQSDLIYLIQPGGTVIKSLGGLKFDVVTLKKSVHLYLFDGRAIQYLGEVALP